MIKMTPAELRQLIEEHRVHWLKTHKLLEVYEAKLQECPDLTHVPGTQIPMDEDLERIRTKLRTNAAKARKALDWMELMLKKD